MQFRVRNRQRTGIRVNRAGSTRIPHVASECLPGLSLATAQLAVTPPRDLCMTAGLHATRANAHALKPNPARGFAEGGREVWAGGLRTEVDSFGNAYVRTRSAPRPRTARAQRPPPAAPTAAATTPDCREARRRHSASTRSAGSVGTQCEPNIRILHPCELVEPLAVATSGTAQSRPPPPLPCARLGPSRPRR